MSQKMDPQKDPKQGKESNELKKGLMPCADRLSVIFGEIEDAIKNPDKLHQINFNLILLRLRDYGADTLTKRQERTLKRFAKLGIAEVLARGENRRDDLIKSNRNEYFRDLRCVYALAKLAESDFTKAQLKTIKEIFSRGTSKALSEVSYDYREVLQFSALTGIPLSTEQVKRIREIGTSIIAQKIGGFYRNELSPFYVFSEVDQIKKISKETFHSLSRGQKSRIVLFVSQMVELSLKEGKFVDPKYVKMIGMPITQELQRRMQKAASATVDRIATNLDNPFVQNALRYVIEGLKKINYVVEVSGIKLTSAQCEKLKRIGSLHVAMTFSYFIDSGRIADPEMASEVSTLLELTNYKLTRHQKSLLNEMAGKKNKK